MADDVERAELVDKLGDAGWYLGGMTRYPDGTVELRLRPAPETSGAPVRSIFGTDENEAIQKELERMEQEGESNPRGSQHPTHKEIGW